MTEFGYTMMCEQSRADQLVRDVRLAEQAGFDFSVISDHYQPWLASQGHSPYTWAVLGAAANATERIGLMTYVTCPILRCPILRYHPAVVAQKAATVQILSHNRFRLGLGAGENLNEHIVGERWQSVGVRHEMLSEAIDVISALFDGQGTVNFRGKHFDVESAKLWDLPDQRVQVLDQLACGPDVQEHVEKIRPYIDAGFTEIALVQIGADTQADFTAWAERELLPALRSL
jgi:G6PDH family F420-dependent oxidoreductase